MLTATVLLIVIGLVGAADIAWFHSWKAKLVLRRESRREAWIHVGRGYCYTAQFLVVPNLELHGAWYALVVLLFAVDVGIAVADVLEEPRSRAAQGGLCGGEYLMHIALSVLVGAYLFAVFHASLPWIELPSALAWSPIDAPAVRLVALLMALGAFSVATFEALILIEQSLGPPAPLHVRVRLNAPPSVVWNLTQDHRLHPQWDHRFSRIVLAHEDHAGAHQAPLGQPDPRITTGTTMRYEKRLLGVTVHGFGRYKLHQPCRQSTFEFWSDDPRSLIRRGVGLWRYLPLADGRTEFATSYTYEVRWGIFGRVVDRFMFRPLFQRYTEQSFRRLARRHFGDPSPRVLGREGRKPRQFQPDGLAA